MLLSSELAGTIVRNEWCLAWAQASRRKGSTQALATSRLRAHFFFFFIF